MAQTFTFELDSLNITTTRSLIYDSDFVSFTLAVNPQGGHGTPQTQTKSMGEIRGGSHNVGLVFADVVVNPTDTVVLSYIVLNCGLDWNTESYRDTIESLMQKVGADLAPLTMAPTPPGTLRIPQLASALPVLVGWLDGEFYRLTRIAADPYHSGAIGEDDCDGTVAVEQSSFAYQDLVGYTSRSRFHQTAVHPGTTSAHGCGANSNYSVSWHIDSAAAVKTVPSVIGLPYKQAEAAILKAGPYLEACHRFDQRHGRQPVSRRRSHPEHWKPGLSHPG